MRIIKPKCATAHSIKFFSENDFILATTARTAITTEINMIPSNILDFIIHNISTKSGTIIRPNSPKIFRLDVYKRQLEL